VITQEQDKRNEEPILPHKYPMSKKGVLGPRFELGTFSATSVTVLILVLKIHRMEEVGNSRLT
jgi:hypothetical protein